MSTGWGRHEPAPIEFLHSRILDLFHEYRMSKTDKYSVEITGHEFNKIFVQAKNETYAKYHKLKLQEPILKTEM